MFGAVIGILAVLYVIKAIVNVTGVIVGAAFSGLMSLIAGIFSGKGFVLGIAIGLVWYFLARRKAAGEE